MTEPYIEVTRESKNNPGLLWRMIDNICEVAETKSPDAVWISISESATTYVETQGLRVLILPISWIFLLSFDELNFAISSVSWLTKEYEKCGDYDSARRTADKSLLRNFDGKFIVATAAKADFLSSKWKELLSSDHHLAPEDLFIGLLAKLRSTALRPDYTPYEERAKYLGSTILEISTSIQKRFFGNKIFELTDASLIASLQELGRRWKHLGAKIS